MKGGKYYQDDLRCFVREIAYHFKERTCFIYLEDDSCTNMSGAIALARRISPDVREIMTFQHTDDEGRARIDTCYVWDGEKWTAYDGRLAVMAKS